MIVRLDRAHGGRGERSQAERAAQCGGGEAPKYLLGDHLGSTSVRVNADGSGLQVQGYLPWGETRFGGVGTEYQYTGQFNQATLGLYYYGARWYDSYLNRWTSPDTVIPNPINSLDYDRYSFVRNNPLRYQDPSGHSPCGMYCPGEDIDETRIRWGLSYHGTWDIQQQKQNAELAESLLVNTTETVIGVVFEPADWAIALGDGFQWYDTLAFAPLIPAGLGDELFEGNRRAVQLFGQRHHIFTSKIISALKKHPTLNGIFKRNDLVVQAIDEIGHKGYQRWHREYDDAVVEWLAQNPKASVEQFLDYIARLYKGDELIEINLKERFPDALEYIHSFKDEIVEGIQR